MNAFDANCYLYLSRAMDRFELGAHGDPVAVLGRAGLEQALVIGVESDLLFSIAEQQAVSQALQAGGAATRFAPCNASKVTTPSCSTSSASGGSSGHFWADWGGRLAAPSGWRFLP